MALARVKTWNAGDTLTAADLNAEYNNILNNPTSLINLTAAGDLAMVSSAATVTRLAIGTAGQSVITSTSLLPAWGTVALQGYLSGCQVTAIGGTTSGTLTHSSGIAVDSTSNVVAMVLSSSLVGTTTGTFVAGSTQPKLDTNSTGLATSQWYHIYVISSALGGSVDVLYSSSTSPTMPTGFSKQRRVGSFRTGSTGNILSMTQDGDYFQWATPTADFAVANPGTAAASRTMQVPTGVNVWWIGSATIDSATAGIVQGLFTDLATNNTAPSTTLTHFTQQSGVLNTVGLALAPVRTNLSAQIRTRLSASDGGLTLGGMTLGWYDSRGKTV